MKPQGQHSFTGEQVLLLKDIRHDLIPVVAALKTVAEELNQEQLQPFIAESIKQLQKVLDRVDGLTATKAVVSP
jgi:hypothetical protein